MGTVQKLPVFAFEVVFWKLSEQHKKVTFILRIGL